MKIGNRKFPGRFTWILDKNSKIQNNESNDDRYFLEIQ